MVLAFMPVINLNMRYDRFIDIHLPRVNAFLPGIAKLVKMRARGVSPEVLPHTSQVFVMEPAARGSRLTYYNFRNRKLKIPIDISTGWTIGVLGFDSWRGLRIFLFTTAS